MLQTALDSALADCHTLRQANTTLKHTNATLHHQNTLGINLMHASLQDHVDSTLIAPLTRPRYHDTQHVLQEKSPFKLQLEEPLNSLTSQTEARTPAIDCSLTDTSSSPCALLPIPAQHTPCFHLSDWPPSPSLHALRCVCVCVCE